ncbi:MAG TPA: hypothetical protein VES20_24280, partial [Bryobacteraceae bacterium]|nr:hypothetical protein [Bryobacteraceae bacterium]
MSVQIFLQGKLQGTDAFLRAAQGDLAGRAQWATLAGEVVPRALLAELRLSPLLLGASGGGQFLMVLPQETRERAEQFLRDTSAALEARTGYLVSLAWAFTEDLG